MDVIVPCDGIRCAQVLTNDNRVTSLTSDQKRQLIFSPKPTPDLSITQTTIDRTRTFRRSAYKTHWVVGCSHTNKLYCWCCIFFSNETTVWCTSGYNDLNNLSTSKKRHSNSVSHLIAVISFFNFGKQQIQTSLPHEVSDDFSKYNAQVENNRKIFQRLVDIVIHLAQQELPLGLDKFGMSLNSDNFLELVSLLSKYDVTLQNHNMQKQHHQSSNLDLNYISNKIQNNIINSIADVMKARINFEVKETKFVSILIDETPDYGHQENFCLILRYYFGYEIHDRFLHFIDVSDNLTADSISHIVLEALKEYNCTKKLVAQSYDGASLMYGVRKEVQQKVKDVCPEAIYTWCNAHNLSLKLAKSCNRIGEVSVFFSALYSLCNFFSHNTKRAAFYNTYCSQTLPHAPATRWMYVSQVVNTVFEQRSKLISLFSGLCDNPDGWDGDTILAAESISNNLNSFSFNFFLLIFHQIFEISEKMHHNLCKWQCDIDFIYCTNKIREFQLWLHKDYQFEFKKIYEKTLQNNLAPNFKREVNCPHKEYNRIFCEVIEIIFSEFNDHYSEINKLRFLQLLNHRNFSQYKSRFPTETFNVLIANYGNYFDRATLKNQLFSLHSSPQLKDRNIFELIDFINNNAICESFNELLKLAYLCLTIPATCFTERAFSSLDRIHTYLRNTQGQERHSDLAMVAIDKQLILELKRSPTFYSDVIKSFLEKDIHFKLDYKY